jgi:hypothetical protein
MRHRLPPEPDPSGEYLLALARQTLCRYRAAHRLASHVQRLVWLTDLRVFLQNAWPLDCPSWRVACIVNETLFWHRHKNQSLPEALASAQRTLGLRRKNRSFDS